MVVIFIGVVEAFYRVVAGSAQHGALIGLDAVVASLAKNVVPVVAVRLGLNIVVVAGCEFDFGHVVLPARVGLGSSPHQRQCLGAEVGQV